MLGCAQPEAGPGPTDTVGDWVEGQSADIFDMDGLMVDSERVALQAWRSAAGLHGYAQGEDVYLLALLP